MSLTRNEAKGKRGVPRTAPSGSDESTSIHDAGLASPSAHDSQVILPGSARRSLTDICFDILNALWVDADSKPTQLMYRTNLSWNVMVDLLAHLEGRGLISSTKVGARRTISLTPIGKICLQKLWEARALIMTAPEDDPQEGFPYVGKRAFSF
jgi:predicted transcriptional regulator